MSFILWKTDTLVDQQEEMLETLIPESTGNMVAWRIFNFPNAWMV